MAGCCNSTSKLLNYLFNTVIFLIGAVVIAAGIYLLVSNFHGFVEKWWVWVGIGSGLLLVILSFVGCSATKSQNRCILSAFWILSGVLFVLFLLAAIGATIYYSYSDQLSAKTALELNDLGGTQENVYDSLRTAYGTLWTSSKCSGAGCDPSSSSCRPVACEDKVVEDTFNRWLREGVTSARAFAVCTVGTVGSEGFNGNTQAASGWCKSQTAAIADVRVYTFGLMIALWVITAFMLLLVIGNCVLICGKKSRKGGMLTPSTPASTAQVVQVPQSTTAVHVVKV